MKDSLMFLSSFIRNPRETGALTASSKFLTREIVKNINFKKARKIAELGPGVGTFTKEILKKSHPDTNIFCFEVNRKFCRHLECSMGSNITILNAGAQKLSENLMKLGVGKVDCIVSGLPFRNFSMAKRKKILGQVAMSLNEKGKFILFQYTNGLLELLGKYFSKVERKFVALNVPPSFIYICGK
jgi:phospholipid N-methyltransferase